jgi:predicted nucleic acid-binding protein
MMRLAVDANVLVGELLRARGRALVADERLRLFIAEYAWEEAQHELGRRVAAIEARGILTAEQAALLLSEAIAATEGRIVQIVEPLYADRADEARWRIPRDPDDWHTVALALAYDAAIWTYDADFLGCGIATWTTETLLAHLAWLAERGEDG